MSKRLSDYINIKLKTLDKDSPERQKMILQSKKQFYAKEEANDLMLEEQQRRDDMSKDRASAIK